MLFNFGLKNKTVKQLRKNKGCTAKELAHLMKVNANIILKVDNRKIREIPEPLKSKILDALEL